MIDGSKKMTPEDAYTPKYIVSNAINYYYWSKKLWTAIFWMAKNSCEIYCTRRLSTKYISGNNDKKKNTTNTEAGSHNRIITTIRRWYIAADRWIFSPPPCTSLDVRWRISMECTQDDGKRKSGMPSVNKQIHVPKHVYVLR